MGRPATRWKDPIQAVYNHYSSSIDLLASRRLGQEAWDAMEIDLAQKHDRTARDHAAVL